jgi:plastocyanin
MHRNLSLAFSALVLLAVLVAVVAFGRQAQSAPSNVVTVTIHDYKFEPETVTLHQGETVEWKNADTVAHTATVDGQKPAFDSGNLSTGATWRYVAATKGTYNYICTIHKFMKGQLIVQ